MSEIPLLTLDSSAEEFLSALSTTGFLHLQLPDSGSLTLAHVEKQFSISTCLYEDTCVAERQQYSRDDDPDFNGFSGVGSTYLNREGGQIKADWKETFGYGRFAPGAKWEQKLPEKMDHYRADLQSFHDGCYYLMLKVLDKLSLAFELSEDHFRKCHSHQGANSVTLINYPSPPHDYNIVDQDIRAGPHKDWGGITLLFQEENGQPGLEIFLPDSPPQQGGVRLMNEVEIQKGSWRPAPIIPNTVLINLGLMMEAWTGGKCVATLHRVVFPPQVSSKSRKSIAYFGTPDPTIVLHPVRPGGNVDRSKTAVTVHEFFVERLRKALVPVNEREELHSSSSMGMKIATTV